MNQKEKQSVILLIDDEKFVRIGVCLFLESEGYKVIEATDGQHGIEVFQQQKPDMVICDLRMPRVDGLEVLAYVTKESPDTPFVVLSGAGGFYDVLQALRLGAWDYLTKPVRELSFLAHTVSKCLERSRLIRENKRHQKYLEEEVAKRTRELEASVLRAEKLAIKAESANRAKSEFLANISHEFNTPLNSILLLSEVLSGNSNSNLSEKQLRMLNQIHSSGSELLSLVNDVLEFASWEKTELNIQKTEVPVEKIIERIKRVVSPLAEKKSLEYNITVDKVVPENIYIDYSKTFRIIRNIISNAIKFTKSGKIKINIGKLDENIDISSFSFSSDEVIAFEIIDTGIGIPQEKCDSIFELFQVVDGTTTRSSTGPGVGLTVSKKLAKALGGDIWLDSKLGKGSRFVLFLPCTIPPSDSGNLSP